MTTISTFGQQQSLIQHMLRNQQNVGDSQQRIASGKNADDFKGYAGETSPLLLNRADLARTDAYVDANEELAQQLDIYNITVGSLADIADELRQEVIKTVNLGDSVGFMDKVRAMFDRAVSLLNTEINGRPMFAGSRFDTPPVAATTEAALLALPTTADAFVNNTDKATVRVDETQTVQFGILADEVATDLFDGLRRIMQWNAGTLPTGATGTPTAFVGTLNDDQRNFLIGEMATAVTAIDTVRSFEAANGVRMEMVDRIITRQEDESVFFKSFVARIEDVNLEEVIIQLNTNSTILEASMQVVSRMSQLSLMNFI